MLLLLNRSRMLLNNLRCFTARAATFQPVFPDRLGQLKKPFPAGMVGTTANPLGETAYEADPRCATPSKSFSRRRSASKRLMEGAPSEFGGNASVAPPGLPMYDQNREAHPHPESAYLGNRR